MRKTLVVMVMAGAGCWAEPAPQAPINTPTAEQVTPPPVTPPPVGRLVVEAHGNRQRPDVEQTFGPVIASGTEAGRPWIFRGRIDADGAATFVQTGTGGGGGHGALPFQKLSWKTLGHFGSFGSGDHQAMGARTFNIDGVVSKQTAAIEVRFADGTSLPAQIIDT